MESTWCQVPAPDSIAKWQQLTFHQRTFTDSEQRFLPCKGLFGSKVSSPENQRFTKELKKKTMKCKHFNLCNFILCFGP